MRCFWRGRDGAMSRPHRRIRRGWRKIVKPADLLVKLGDAVQLRYIGIGFIWAWIYCSFDTSAVYSDRAGASINSDPAWLGSAAAVVVTLIFLGIASRKKGLPSNRVIPLIAAVAMAIGTFASSLVTGNVLASMALGVATGIGSGVLILYWGEVLSDIDPEQAEIAIPAASLITLVCALVFPYLGGMVGALGASSLPLLSAAFLFASYEHARAQGAAASRDGAEEGAAPGVSGAADRGVSQVRVVLRLLLLLLVAYFCVGCVSALESSQDRFQVVYGFDVASMLGSVSGLLLAVWFILYSPRVDISSLFRWLSPLMVVGVAMLAWDAMAPEFIRVAVVSISDTVLQITVLLYFVGQARRGFVSAAFAIGLSQGIVQLGVLLGNVAGSELARGDTPLWCVAIALMCALSVAMAFAPSAIVGEAAQDDGRSRSEAGDARTERDAEESRRKNTLARLIEEGGLSAREAEILDFLSKGRSQPYIRDALVLSKNTVATHVKHIYQKLGVHSKQELLDLFDDKDAEA